MAYYFISGPLLNTLTRPVAAGTPTPAADLDFPLSQLYDGVAAQPFRFSTSTSDAAIVFDLNLLTNPGFETALSTTSTTGWLAVTGSSMINSTDYANTGSYSMRVSGMAYHDVTVRPNEGIRLEWAVYDQSATTGTVYIKVQCMDLGECLSSSGGWSTASTTYVVKTTGSGAWRTGSVTFSTPTVASLLQDTATLRVMMVGCSTYGYFDDILLYPGVSWVSAHGHNWTTTLTPKVSGSSSSTAYTLVDTLSHYRDVSLATFSTTYYRYWKFELAGIPYEAPYCGELIFGQYEAVLKNPMYGSAVEYREKQARKESPNGTVYVYNRGTQPLRTLKGTFDYSDSTQYYQGRRSLMRASRGGANMIAMFASEMDVEQVIYGRISESMAYVKTDGVFWTVNFEVVEDALPIL